MNLLIALFWDVGFGQFPSPQTSLPPYGTEFVQAKEEILEEAIPAAQRKAKEAAQQRWVTVEMWEAHWLFGKKGCKFGLLWTKGAIRGYSNTELMKTFFFEGIQDLPTVLFILIFSPAGFASVVPRRGGASVRCDHFQTRGFETPKSPTENGLFSVTTRWHFIMVRCAVVFTALYHAVPWNIDRELEKIQYRLSTANEDFPAEFEVAWPGSLQCNYDCMAQYTPGSAFGQMYVANIGLVPSWCPVGVDFRVSMSHGWLQLVWGATSGDTCKITTNIPQDSWFWDICAYPWSVALFPFQGLSESRPSTKFIPSLALRADDKKTNLTEVVHVNISGVRFQLAEPKQSSDDFAKDGYAPDSSYTATCLNYNSWWRGWNCHYFRKVEFWPSCLQVTITSLAPLRGFETLDLGKYLWPFVSICVLCEDLMFFDCLLLCSSSLVIICDNAKSLEMMWSMQIKGMFRHAQKTQLFQPKAAAG